jgi:glycosyltransferase involved in cell wall biosynthesis
MKEVNPFFSIVVPTYNRAASIGSCIRSVIAQEYIHWELIVVDDGSTDDTARIVKSFDDLRIRYIYQENKERSAARNKGIAMSSGRYICFLDSDDLYENNHLSSIYNVLAQADFPVAFTYTSFTSVGPDGVKVKKRHDEKKMNESFLTYFLRNMIMPSCVCIHRNILMEFRFDETLRMGEDSDLFFRILSGYPCMHVRVFTVLYTENVKSADRSKRKRDYLDYIKTWTKIFSIEEVKRQVPLEQRNGYLSRQYEWLLYDLYKELPWAEYRSYVAQLRKLNGSRSIKLTLKKITGS